MALDGEYNNVCYNGFETIEDKTDPQGEILHPLLKKMIDLLVEQAVDEYLEKQK